jgi:plastocyanin
MNFMTFRTRIAMTAGFVLALGACALLPFGTGPKPQREVSVTARNMAYYVGGDSTSSNPVIRVAPGERLRINLVNKDRGVVHDLAIRDWKVETPLVHDDESTSVVVQVPETPGRFTYVCTLHAAMMKGTIEVVPGGSAHSAGD